MFAAMTKNSFVPHVRCSVTKVCLVKWQLLRCATVSRCLKWSTPIMESVRNKIELVSQRFLQRRTSASSNSWSVSCSACDSIERAGDENVGSKRMR